MKLLRVDEETTANIGTIIGGEATNVVCPYVEVKAEARSLNMDKLNNQIEHMTDCFQKASEKFGAEVYVENKLSYRNYAISEEDEILEIIREACDKIGVTFKLESTGGGSDVNVFASKGIKTVNLGTGMSKDHTVEEYIKVKDLVNVSRLVLQIMLRNNKII
ncbi:Acetylornithine deacetylase [bioreactor metagenome]|uniref:Acetylornithine deacetylase n=1 Tax=bioreactor metagenome TaxID=1076179 RepID=A0A645H3H5_9ZZZZ